MHEILKMPGLQFFTETKNICLHINRLIRDHMVCNKDFQNTKADDKAGDFRRQWH